MDTELSTIDDAPMNFFGAMDLKSYALFADKLKECEIDASFWNEFETRYKELLVLRKTVPPHLVKGQVNFLEKVGYADLKRLDDLLFSSSTKIPYYERTQEWIRSCVLCGEICVFLSRISYLLKNTHALPDTTLPKNIEEPRFFKVWGQIITRMSRSGELAERENAYREHLREPDFNKSFSLKLSETLSQSERDSLMIQIIRQSVDAYYQRLLDIGDEYRPWYEKQDELHRQKQITTPVPDRQAQQTGQMIRTINAAFGDAPTLRRWESLDGQIALRHVIQGWSLETLLMPGKTLTWWGRDDSVEALQSELMQMGIEAVFLVNVLIGMSLHEGQVTIGLDELIRAIGRGDEARRNAESRNRVRRDVWRAVLVFDALAVVGRLIGRYTTRDTKEVIDVTMPSTESVIKITGTIPDRISPDGNAPPAIFSYVCGPWIARMKGNRQVMTQLGDIMQLARIPAGKPSATWAKSIGLNLNQRWREWAHDAQVADAGETAEPAAETADRTARFDKIFTRRDLLAGEEMYRADPDVLEILKSRNPNRAKVLWKEAIVILRETGGPELLSFYKELDPQPVGRKGWQEAWLDQPLDIRPNHESMKEVIEIAEASAKMNQARTKRAA